MEFVGCIDRVGSFEVVKIGGDGGGDADKTSSFCSLEASLIVLCQEDLPSSISLFLSYHG
jgi:hypothetical protein